MLMGWFSACSGFSSYSSGPVRGAFSAEYLSVISLTMDREGNLCNQMMRQPHVKYGFTIDTNPM